ncbi:choice-of-anchor J domain-containing protein [Mesonia sp. MT50]|uniref:Choice-of-anchor J domain-containing protein n=1 Tax=Mesonia profundi TaxID=3070998 RepID=A0ABU1A2Y8_9FLAO|nr:choice-of-anchor J domain-containing protein [Mesonia profundi]MDQ7918080.1 choice-of-anchor J domain-containing protein [Mesonia profundi]
MKNTFYLLTLLLGFTFFSCEPMDDVYEELDANAESSDIAGTADFVLTDEDYEALDLGFGSFNSEEEAKELLPGFLAEKFPYWGKGSTALVGYNLYVGEAEGVSDFAESEQYQLSNDDYVSLGNNANGFYPNTNVESDLVAVLEANFSNPSEGQIVLTKYKQYTEEPTVGYASLVEYNFQDSFEGWTSVSVTGAQEWEAQTDYIQASGFDNGQVENEDWVVSPEIDLTNETDLKFQISQAINYANDVSFMKIYASTNYTGDVTSTTWDEISLTTTPAGDSNDFILSEEYDFTAYEGETIHLALEYNSTDTDAGRWRVEDVFVKTVGITGASNAETKYFMYTEGNWELADNAYFLSPLDYDAMGAPGQYDNFSSSIDPNNYIPTFLGNTYPYAQEEDQMFVIYNYYNGEETVLSGNSYTYTDGAWIGHKKVMETSLQFGHNGEIWVPDNTIAYTLTPADFALLAAGLEDAYPDPAYSAGNYANFDRREGNNKYWSVEMIVEGINIVLDNMDPNAEEGQKYAVTYDIYDGSSGTETQYVIKQGGIWVLQE